MNHVKHSLGSADISIFSRKICKFAISRNTDKSCILLHKFYLKYCFLKNGHNFDDINKNGNSRSS